MAADSSTALTVACISVSSALGGSEWSLLEFARRASRHDINALVLVPKEGPLADALRADQVKVAVATAPASLLSLSQREMISLGGIVTLTTGLAAWSRAISKAAKDHFGAAPQL